MCNRCLDSVATLPLVLVWASARRRATGAEHRVSDRRRAPACARTPLSFFFGLIFCFARKGNAASKFCGEAWRAREHMGARGAASGGSVGNAAPFGCLPLAAPTLGHPMAVGDVGEARRGRPWRARRRGRRRGGQQGARWMRREEAGGEGQEGARTMARAKEGEGEESGARKPAKARRAARVIHEVGECRGASGADVDEIQLAEATSGGEELGGGAMAPQSIIGDTIWPCDAEDVCAVTPRCRQTRHGSRHHSTAHGAPSRTLSEPSCGKTFVRA